MKIYINTDKQPPVAAATVKTQTDATGVLRVYSAAGASGISNFKFKRGTTVPVEIVFTDAEAAAEITKLRFGIKLAGRYDDLLVVAAEADGAVAEDNDDGTVSFHLKLTLDATAIDAALAVNGIAGDDIEQAAFISEIEWENAAGERTATETVPAAILNNVVRGSAATSGTTAGTWTALMVIRMSWAEFSALENRNPDAIHIVPDAPDPVEEHNADPSAHEQTFGALRDDFAAKIAALSERVSEAENELVQTPSVVPASDTVSGTVKTGGNGISANNNVLALKTRETHSGIAFENKAAFVNTATSEHPVAGTTLPVGTDSAGKLCVPALTTHGAKLAAPVLSGPVLVDALIGFPAKVLCPAIDNNAACRAYYGTFANLGCAAAADIFPTAITVYRRNGYSANGDRALFLRVLRKNEDGSTWRVAFESTNTIRANDYTNDGAAMTWHLANKDGKGAIPPDEEIAIVQTTATTNAATATFGWGTKTTSAIRGGIAEGQDLLPANVLAFAPALDVEYQQCVPLYGLIMTIFDELGSRE